MKELKNLFKDKNFIIFTLISFIFFILFYEYLDNNIKCEIYNTITKPIIVVLLIGLIGIILKYNFTIGIMLALSFVIIITLKPCNKKNNETKINKSRSRFNNTDIEGFKNKTFLEKTINNITNSLQEGIQENKKLENSLNNISSENTEHNKSNKNNTNTNSKSPNNSNKLEIPKRKFDLDKRDDKVLIYSKEVLKDIINRINYEFDDRDYLKKYIGNKFEEIIDLLGLLEN